MKYAFSGLIQALRQTHLKIHISVALIAICLGIFFRLPYLEWGVLILTISLVIVSEIINTAIEATVDLVTSELHPKAKLAKDVAAGAVLVAAFFSLWVGYLLFFHRLATLLHGG